jgi:hypothetical protein
MFFGSQYFDAIDFFASSFWGGGSSSAAAYAAHTNPFAAVLIG